MRLGEVGLLTNDVVKLADFYKKLLEIDNGSEDETHQTLICEETMLTVYNDGSKKNNQNQNVCLAFTVDDIEHEYKKILALGAQIIEPPTKRPWGATNMSFYDPDNNVIYLRSFSKDISLLDYQDDNMSGKSEFRRMNDYADRDRENDC